MCLPSFSAAKPTVSEETAKIWSLSASDVVDEEIVSKLLHMQSHQYHSLSWSLFLHYFPPPPSQELMDSDTLLAEEDLLKPDPTTLRSKRPDM